MFEKVTESAAVPCVAAEIAESAISSEVKSAVTVAVLSALCLIFVGMAPILAVLVVTLALFRVAEDLVGLVYLLETLLSVRVAWVQVGVITLCQPAVRLLYLVLAGVAVDTECLVVVNECHSCCFEIITNGRCSLLIGIRLSCCMGLIYLKTLCIINNWAIFAAVEKK